MDTETTDMDIIAHIAELEREFFGDDEPLLLPTVAAKTKNKKVNPPVHQTTLEVDSGKRPVPKKKFKCKVCGTEAEDKFYPYWSFICKGCYRARKNERTSKPKAQKKEHMTKPKQGIAAKQPYTGAELVERCGAEIRAAGRKGIFQKDLRYKCGLDKQICKLVVKELVDDGLIEHSGERSASGSPKLVWKNLDHTAAIKGRWYNSLGRKTRP